MRYCYVTLTLHTSTIRSTRIRRLFQTKAWNALVNVGLDRLKWKTIEREGIEPDIEEELHGLWSRARPLRVLCTRNNHELSPSLHGQTRRTERGDSDSIPVRAYQLHCGSRYCQRSWPHDPGWSLRHLHRNSKTNPSIDHLATLALGPPHIYRLRALEQLRDIGL